MFNDVVIVCIFLRNRVLRFRQKNNPLMCRCNFYSLCSEKNVYHSSASKFLHKKRHSCEFFTKNDNSVKKSVKFSVKKFLSILCSHRCGLIFTRFHAFTLWRKTGMLNIIRPNFSLRPRLLASYSSLYTTDV